VSERFRTSLDKLNHQPSNPSNHFVQSTKSNQLQDRRFHQQTRFQVDQEHGHEARKLTPHGSTDHNEERTQRISEFPAESKVYRTELDAPRKLESLGTINTDMNSQANDYQMAKHQFKTSIELSESNSLFQSKLGGKS